jgi:hypothetical protein
VIPDFEPEYITARLDESRDPGPTKINDRLEALGRSKPHHPPLIPAFAGISGASSPHYFFSSAA